MSTAERQKVADGLAALLESATAIPATLDGGDRSEKAARRAPMVRDPAFRARMREQRRSRRPGEKGGA